MDIRKITGTEKINAIKLVWKVFLEFEAPYFEEKGVIAFRNSISNPEIINELVIYGAYENESLIGVIATRNKGNHIALLFVDKKYHRRGIGRKLFEVVLKNSTANIITVNSSPYAIGFYHKLGFVDIGREQTRDGMIFTPMKYQKQQNL